MNLKRTALLLAISFLVLLGGNVYSAQRMIVGELITNTS